METIEQAAKAYQEKEQGMWTGKGMAKDFQSAFITGVQWQKMQKSDFQELWEQSIQLDGLHTFEEAQATCPPGYRVPTEEEWRALIANTTYSFDKKTKEGVFTFSDGFELRLPAAGYRTSAGNPYGQGTYGYYWSSSPSGTYASSVNFSGSTVNSSTNYRANAFSVRCVPIETQ